jgi:hypothetical protein
MLVSFIASAAIAHATLETNDTMIYQDCQSVCDGLSSCTGTDGSFCQSDGTCFGLYLNETGNACYSLADALCDITAPGVPCNQTSGDGYASGYDANSTIAPAIAYTLTGDDFCMQQCSLNELCATSTHTSFCRAGDLGTFSVCWGLFKLPDSTTCYKPEDPSCQELTLDPVGCSDMDLMMNTINIEYFNSTNFISGGYMLSNSAGGNSTEPDSMCMNNGTGDPEVIASNETANPGLILLDQELTVKNDPLNTLLV